MRIIKHITKPFTQECARLVRAAGFSWDGLKAAYKHEAAFRTEILLAIILLPLAYFMADSINTWFWLSSAWLLVLLMELINSAIEATVDRFGEEKHELAKRAKDIGSAAVAVAIAWAVIVWLVVIVRHTQLLIKG